MTSYEPKPAAPGDQQFNVEIESIKKLHPTAKMHLMCFLLSQLQSSYHAECFEWLMETIEHEPDRQHILGLLNNRFAN